MEFIPLLSGKMFSEFSPLEYRTYVKSLFLKRVPRASAKKKPKVEFLAKLTKKGNLTISVRRKPKWITRAEIELIRAQLNFPLNEIWIYLGKHEIKVMEPEEAKRIADEIKEIPF